MKIAIIDLGSNSVRMNIVEIINKQYTVLEQHKESVRLSEGMGQEKLLKPPAIARTIDAMAEFKKIIDKHQITDIYAIATAAVRMAKNAEDITKPLLDKFNIKLNVISGEKEAYYDYLGVINTSSNKDCLIVDTGGASTEIILVRGGISLGFISLPFGAVNITENYLGSDKLSNLKFLSTCKIFEDELNKISWLDNAKNLPIIGLGGSVRAVAKAEKIRRQKADEPLHNFEMSDNDLFAMTMRLNSLSLEECKKTEGIGKSRADIICGGLVPIYSIMKKINSPTLIISTSGLREGVLFDIL